MWPHGCSGHRRARPPARLGDLTTFGAAPRSPPVPSGPSGALHTGGAGSLMCALRVDSLSGQAPLPPINFARNSPATYSNIEFASLELQCFWGVSKIEHDQLRAKFGRRWCRCCPWASQPGPPVPPVPFMPVGPGVLLWMAPSLPRMRYKVRPARLLAGDSGIKFALRAKNVPIWAILSEQGEFCTGHPVRRGVQGEFCPAVAPSVCPVAGLSPPVGTAARPSGPSGVLPADAGGGFAALGAG